MDKKSTKRLDFGLQTLIAKWKPRTCIRAPTIGLCIQSDNSAISSLIFTGWRSQFAHLSLNFYKVWNKNAKFGLNFYPIRPSFDTKQYIWNMESALGATMIGLSSPEFELCRFPTMSTMRYKIAPPLQPLKRGPKNCRKCVCVCPWVCLCVRESVSHLYSWRINCDISLKLTTVNH